MVSIHGIDGFGESSPSINSLPSWIQTIYQWNDEGLLSEQDLDIAIDYLVQNDIIQIV